MIDDYVRRQFGCGDLLDCSARLVEADDQIRRCNNHWYTE